MIMILEQYIIIMLYETKFNWNIITIINTNRVFYNNYYTTILTHE